jgi:hypothetical protein
MYNSGLQARIPHVEVGTRRWARVGPSALLVLTFSPAAVSVAAPLGRRCPSPILPAN